MYAKDESNDIDAFQIDDACLISGVVAVLPTGSFVGWPLMPDADTAEVYLSWEGIEGIEDVTDALGGYSFTVYNSEVRNWQDTVHVTCEHLKAISEG